MSSHLSRSTLQRYLDEELAADVARVAAQHLESCAACSAALSRAVEDALAGELAPVAQELRDRRPVDPASDAASDAPPARQGRGGRRRWIVAAAVAASLLFLFTMIDLDPVNADVILERLGGGPREVSSATYVLGTANDGSEVVFGGPGTFLARRHRDRALHEVAAENEGVGWSFDVSSDRLDVATDGAAVEPELSLLNPFDAAALVRHLREHCEVAYAGEVDDMGVPCWVLECAPRDDRGMACELVIDQVANIVRRASGARLGELRLVRTGDVVEQGDLLPTRYVTPATKVRVDEVAGGSVVAFCGRFAAGELPPEVASAIGPCTQVFASRLSEASSRRLAGIAAELARAFVESGRLDAFVEDAGFSLPVPGDVARSMQEGCLELADGDDLPRGLEQTIDPEKLRGLRGLEELCRILSRETGVPIDLEAEAPPLVFIGFDERVPMPAWAAVKMLAAIHGLEARVVDGRVKLTPKRKSGSGSERGSKEGGSKEDGGTESKGGSDSKEASAPKTGPGAKEDSRVPAGSDR